MYPKVNTEHIQLMFAGSCRLKRLHILFFSLFFKKIRKINESNVCVCVRAHEAWAQKCSHMMPYISYWNNRARAIFANGYEKKRRRRQKNGMRWKHNIYLGNCTVWWLCDVVVVVVIIINIIDVALAKYMLIRSLITF